MNLQVTGTNGFIGRALTARLQSQSFGKPRVFVFASLIDLVDDMT